MNHVKIQKKILDNFLKTNSELFCLTFDDCYWISDNRFQLFRIEKSEMWLNVEKMMQGRQYATSLAKIINVEGEDAHLTNEMKQLPSKTVVKIASTNNQSWVDKKLLDRFEIKTGLHFTLSNKKNGMILVWEDETLCGLICPVMV